MPQEPFVVGLDIGSTAVRLAVGQIVPTGAETELQIVGVSEVPASGISKGVISSIEDATAAVSSCVEKAERMLGAPLERAWVGISGLHILTEESRGVVAVGKPNGEITEEDVERAIEAARTVATPLNYEILHVIPKSFTVDGQSGIKDPVGMTGIRLEVDAQIIQGLSSQIKNLTKCIYRTGFDIEDLVLSVLATAETVTSARQKELGVAVVNIGGSTTGYAVFEEGDLLTTGIIPIGGDHVTADIAIGLRTSIDVAERVKIEYGTAIPKELNKKEEINLEEIGGEQETVSRKYVAEIIQARMEEVFEKLDRELKKIGRSGMLPSGVVFTGGGAKLSGLIELAKEKLRLPASLGYPGGVSSTLDRVSDLSFATAVGLTVWGAEMERKGGGGKLSRMINLKGLSRVTGGLRKLFKSLIP
ncbi:cell division protein FtsA [Candidatus Uhrbacteria bacterium RIFCSPLOWO2_01_FULL_47_24]|uniref:Cell division protein FtsA n=1 Tax=Candidatus Uhrbacteria bacterium RIFCSPLOWO2_01_FULL_47_24 TaxID=1802401 RepID=A0A1F7UPH9_9BACT|nr:MAG: cell division protein FtsA [Candidatus Uhrbacteria bacterium RIFCSPHIGHO2_01_FULL_47_11]OGL68084.1 MAG: cell division protein FtsA [Candidatus Uhrbacteria bacterium RIFCSPHIGHO2_02_FULL_46_47]OGL75459.1 MAG: cell division protein FtsA [Candidatus Uhrbacteria bacterium RIFCSPHIGHO2_12_FULL_47_11]OGL80176.1 MAG: cell division protein FtsA [Candidatus Uhrbacteria bacterium RIFCSPLOWO2_01_FULL_47_24]OGL84962.1 MAG: cell division protein FtsA [Candidatus Uhrbacteria bacterium RIFCSPLOWO2_02_